MLRLVHIYCDHLAWNQRKNFFLSTSALGFRFRKIDQITFVVDIFWFHIYFLQPKKLLCFKNNFNSKLGYLIQRLTCLTTMTPGRDCWCCCTVAALYSTKDSDRVVVRASGMSWGSGGDVVTVTDAPTVESSPNMWSPAHKIKPQQFIYKFWSKAYTFQMPDGFHDGFQVLPWGVADWVDIPRVYFVVTVVGWW